MVRPLISALLLLFGLTAAEAASECFTVNSCGVALSNQYSPGQFNACVVDINGNTCTAVAAGGAGFPAGSTPITAVFSGADTASAAATLAGTAGKTTYICGFTVNGLGATAATPVSVTVAAPGGNTLTYQYIFPAGATVASTPLAVTYSPCIPANAQNTSIVITVPGAAGNTATQINATGYQL